MKKFFNKIKLNRGMTYVELIVVLSIFAIMSSIILFNYQSFIERIEVRKMSSLIALKIVEAQKNAISGVLPASFFLNLNNWKPSYGINFDKIAYSGGKEFLLFADINLKNGYNPPTDKSLGVINIGKGVFIKDIIAHYVAGGSSSLVYSRVDLVFTRPSSSMKVYRDGVENTQINMIEILISSGSGNFIYKIEIQSSGRIQIKK